MQVKVILAFDGHEPGEVLEFPDAVAQDLIYDGWIEAVKDEPAADDVPDDKPKRKAKAEL